MESPDPFDNSQPSSIGKYTIGKQLAWSDTSTTYEGVDRTTGRHLPIRVLDLPRHLSETQRRGRIERFYREAKAVGFLTHPNIVTIYEIGLDNDRHFMVMEYLKGHSLEEIERVQGALPLKESLEIALQVGDALGHTHGLGVIHREINPENIHILPGGIIKITNFETAIISAEPSITAHGVLFGSPSYMSPERIASQPVDHRTDIFSLGVTLYEMIAGRRPFVGDSVISITDNIMNSEPPIIQRIQDTVNAVLQRALAKDPNARYQTMPALCSDLRKEQSALGN